MQCQPQKNDTEITFGSFDSETLRSVGIFSTRVKDLYSYNGCKLSKSAGTPKPNIFSPPKSVESTSESGCTSAACSGDSSAEELNQGHTEPPSSVSSCSPHTPSVKSILEQPVVHCLAEVSSSVEDVILDDFANGIHQVDSKKSIFRGSNGFKVIPRDFLPRGLVNLGNLCFLNATLQALLSCSPFFELLDELRNRDIPEVAHRIIFYFTQVIFHADQLTSLTFLFAHCRLVIRPCVHLLNSSPTLTCSPTQFTKRMIRLFLKLEGRFVL